MIEQKIFGTLPSGDQVKLFTLSNKNGVIAKVTNYGGILCSFSIPTNNGQRELVLGFDKLEDYLSPAYLENYPYFGAIIGRYGNRIEHGKFKIKDKDYQLNCNLGKHHLHGGKEGFDRKTWNVKITNEQSIELSYLSKDGEENFPGNLQTKITYCLNDENELQIHYEATCDQTTPINLTQHSYFNLSENSKDILEHSLKVHTNYILETDDDLVPGGKFLNVRGTCFDFRKKKKINRDIEDIENYDDCFAFNEITERPRKVAELWDEKNEIKMEVSTTSPGLQVYTGQHINVKGKFGSFAGIALEAQDYPDAPNKEHFKHGWLSPNEVYRRQTNYKIIF